MALSTARFSPYACGRIVGMAEAGASRPDIAKKVLKRDGAQGSMRAIGDIMPKLVMTLSTTEQTAPLCR